MIVLDKNNMISYLRAHYPAFDTSGQVSVSAIGDDEDDAQGLINYIFRVRNEKGALIVKQARANLRLDDDVESTDANYCPSPDRNFAEYMSLKLRKAVTPDYVPDVYYADPKNHVFLMEDVSYLKPARPQLSHNVMIDGLAERVSRFMCDNHFYTSEFYLDTGESRELAGRFANNGMRAIMENWLFLRDTPTHECPPLTQHFLPYIFADDVMVQSHVLRHKYMNTTEALIHSDVHTTNIFADNNQIKIIDMEYTFAGPVAYDLGYFVASLVSQYCSAVFRSFPSEKERRDFKQYILASIYNLVDGYQKRFAAHWNDESKEVYRVCPGFREAFLAGIVPDLIGYAAMPMFTLCVSSFGLADDFEVIPDDNLKLHALQLHCSLARRFLTEREKVRAPKDIIAVILEGEREYCSYIR